MPLVCLRGLLAQQVAPRQHHTSSNSVDVALIPDMSER